MFIECISSGRWALKVSGTHRRKPFSTHFSLPLDMSICVRGAAYIIDMKEENTLFLLQLSTVGDLPLDMKYLCERSSLHYWYERGKHLVFTSIVYYGRFLRTDGVIGLPLGHTVKRNGLAWGGQWSPIHSAVLWNASEPFSYRNFQDVTATIPLDRTFQRNRRRGGFLKMAVRKNSKSTSL